MNVSLMQLPAEELEALPVGDVSGLAHVRHRPAKEISTDQPN
jgi:hypothetical protein